MTKLESISLMFISFITFGTAVMAQSDNKVTDDELKQFVASVQKIQILNQESQQQMIKIVEDNGLKVERFNEIAEAAQDPNKASDASENEMKKFTDINTSIEKIYASSQKKIEEIIKVEGLSIERYQIIASEIQSKPELQERIQKFINN